jgi:hypothetical protein
VTSTSIRITAIVGLLALTFTLLPGTVLPAVASMNTRTGSDTGLKSSPLRPQASFTVDAESDIFPVLANYASTLTPGYREWGVVTVTVQNPSSAPLCRRIAVEIPGWSDQEIQMADVAAGKVEQYRFAPTLQPHALANRNMEKATIVITATDGAGRTEFTHSAALRIHSIEDMYWGHDSSFARFLASWVTPHDSQVEALLVRARVLVPGGKLPGYESDKNTASQARSTIVQVQAIYRALQQAGLNPAKNPRSASTLIGNLPEHVQLPHDSLQNLSASYIDGAVLYASLFENIGLQSQVLLAPGHAYVGVRLSEDFDDYLYLETAFPAQADFDKAVESAQHGLNHYRESIVSVQIPDARQDGIVPLSSPQKSGVPVETSGLR